MERRPKYYKGLNPLGKKIIDIALSPKKYNKTVASKVISQFWDKVLEFQGEDWFLSEYGGRDSEDYAAWGYAVGYDGELEDMISFIEKIETDFKIDL